MCDCYDAPRDEPSIKYRRARIDAQRQKLNKELEHLSVEIRGLQIECTHPNEFRTSHMGENCLHCPDCGHCP